MEGYQHLKPNVYFVYLSSLLTHFVPSLSKFYVNIKFAKKKNQVI